MRDDIASNITQNTDPQDLRKAVRASVVLRTIRRLLIGIRAIDGLRVAGVDPLRSRKLRSFAAVAFQ